MRFFTSTAPARVERSEALTDPHGKSSRKGLRDRLLWLSKASILQAGLN
jgi:UTP:GlnB (protein PII) uridylyltransferase